MRQILSRCRFPAAADSLPAALPIAETNAKFSILPRSRSLGAHSQARKAVSKPRAAAELSPSLRKPTVSM